MDKFLIVVAEPAQIDRTAQILKREFPEDRFSIQANYAGADTALKNEGPFKGAVVAAFCAGKRAGHTYNIHDLGSGDLLKHPQVETDQMPVAILAPDSNRQKIVNALAEVRPLSIADVFDEGHIFAAVRHVKHQSRRPAPQTQATAGTSDVPFPVAALA
jgi:hypothetical protein